MTAVVQQQVINQGGYSGSFSANVTALDSVILLATGAVFAAAAASSAPTFAGSPAAGAVKLYEIESAGGATGAGVYTTAWLLPNLAGASAAVGLTVVNVFGGAFGLFGIEGSGLGPAPVIVAASTGTAEAGATADSGGITAPAGSLIIASGACFSSTTLTGPGAPWTNTAMTGSASLASSQVSAGGTADWQAALGASVGWVAGIAAIKAGTVTVIPVPAAGDSDRSSMRRHLIW